MEVVDYEVEAELIRFPWFYVVSLLYAIGVTVVLGIRMREVRKRRKSTDNERKIVKRLHRCI